MKENILKIIHLISYKTILIILILTFTAIPSITTFFIVKNYVNSTISNSYTDEYITTVEAKISSYISSLIYQINSLSYYFLTNQSVYNILLNETTSYEDKFQMLENKLSGFLNGNPAIAGICLVDPSDRIYNFSDIIPNDYYVNSKKLKKIHNSDMYLFDKNIQQGNTYYTVTAKKMYNYFTGSEGGYILMYINEDVLAQMYEKFAIDDSSFFLLTNGTIISHQDKSLINSKFYTGGDFFDNGKNSIEIDNQYRIIKKSIETNYISTHLEIVCVNSLSSFHKLLNKINIQFLFIIISAIIISIVLSIIISAGLLSELEKLRKTMRTFGNNPSKTVYCFKLNEIRALENDFKSMTHRITGLIKRIDDEKEKQRIAELAALQAQINPHFIYNTLDTVAWLAVISKNQKIYDIIFSLANFFRLSLNKGRNIIKISEEISHVKNYIKIESIRFENKFSCEFDIPENLNDIEIIKIILQPIVENAIKHGFDGIESGGLIKINARELDGDYIEFTVSDNGCGMDFNPLESPQKSDSRGSGYGIENINARIRLAYGNDCGLSFESKLGRGTVVHIKLKKHMK